MHLAAYDWRLPYDELETRDRYFTRLRRTIELLLDANNGNKAVVIAHSMGATVWLYFMQWVSQPKVGGRDWVSNHIATFVSMAGTNLGAPRSLPAVLSGEVTDMLGLPSTIKYLKDHFVSDRAAIEIFRSSGSVPGIFPKGGPLIWQADQFLENQTQLCRANNSSHGTDQTAGTSANDTCVQVRKDEDKALKRAGIAKNSVFIAINKSLPVTPTVPSIDYVSDTKVDGTSVTSSVVSYQRQGIEAVLSVSDTNFTVNSTVDTLLPVRSRSVLFCFASFVMQYRHHTSISSLVVRWRFC